MLEVMISKKKARRNSASKKKPKRNGKANEAASTPQTGQSEETQKVKPLRGAPKKIRDKMARACERITEELPNHPEFESLGWPCPEFYNKSWEDGGHYYRSHIAEVAVNFKKYGETMMVVPSCIIEGDYDYPDMTDEGFKYLKKTAYDTAKAEGLRIGGRTSTFVQNHEKGLCTVGYIYTVRV